MATTARPIPPPLFVSWELTQRFATDRRRRGPAAPADELSSLEALAVVDELAEAQVPLLGLAGADPLLRPDWRRLVQRAVRRGLGVSLATDGLAVTPEVATELAALGLQSVTVSLDSHLPEAHDEIHQRPGLHAAAEAAIRHLTSRGMRTVVSFTPVARNWGHVAPVVARAGELGAAAATLTEHVPVGLRRDLEPATPAQLQAVTARWSELRSRERSRTVLLGPDLWATLGAPADPGAPCAAARRLARIRPDGTVTPCPYIAVSLGSLREEPFQVIWERAVRGPSPERGSLEVIPVCTACRSLAHAHAHAPALAVAAAAG